MSSLASTVSTPRRGAPLVIGEHFFAYSFRPNAFGEPMGPVLMVDHFWMKRQTFGLHRHEGISAITYVFEDSQSAHMNEDTMGNNLPIRPGDLHWMVAGRGAEHNEKPEVDDTVVHALQIFVDLPSLKKEVEPYAMHLDSADVPQYLQEGARVRVVAGKFLDVVSPVALPQPFSFFDGHIAMGASIVIPIPRAWEGWFYAVRGTIQFEVAGKTLPLAQGFALVLRKGSEAWSARVTAKEDAHFVMLAGPRSGEAQF
ncbi:pirin family protein [Variovorax paradoxus]|uniref:pirin family protein n=1 Tax=Variovorax paradoxus TaxID=34073 RepID=UPI0027800647|nr:pirin family protein [Variovorax paradoxus]MDP9927830.1 redox-sensitive bicupin YhaK (pirin superfamily) [Variovorax paradoxus]